MANQQDQEVIIDGETTLKVMNILREALQNHFGDKVGSITNFSFDVESLNSASSADFNKSMDKAFASSFLGLNRRCKGKMVCEYDYERKVTVCRCVPS